MKKIVLTLAFIVPGVTAFSQNYTFKDITGYDITNTVVNYWVSDSVTDTREFTMTNVSANSVNIKVRKTNLSLNVPTATTWFCTDINCYSPVASLSLAVPLNAGSTSLLTTDFHPNDSIGTGITRVRYTIFDLANASDSSWIEIDYHLANGGPAGIRTTTEKAFVSNPVPNPASSVFMMNYKLGHQQNGDASFAIYNMLGEKMQQTEIADSEGTIRMDVSNFEQGVYFCILESQGKAVATKRLVVSH